MFDKKFLLGVGINNVKKIEVLEFIIKGLENQTEKYYVVTPNAELLVIANELPEYKKVLNSAKIALPDSVGVLIAGKVLNKTLEEKTTGVDFMESLCEGVSKRPITVGFLGGRENVAELTSECLEKKYPGLKVNFVSEEPVAPEKMKPTDILFVAFGSPKQEFWMAENLEKLPIKIAIGVGGSFDFISGKVKRAPVWMRKIGLEWLFRLIIQPWRIKRQFSLIKFVLLVLREKFKS